MGSLVLCQRKNTMTHTYTVSGMTCGSCEAKVQSLLSTVNHVQKVAVDLAKSQVTIDMDRHIATEEFKAALSSHPRYQIAELLPSVSEHHYSEQEESRSWFTTYKPVLLVFAFITGISLVVEITRGTFIWMRWMNHFMAGFFLVFSFFKLLNLRGFADSYRMYDIVAKKWPAWGYLYAFVELFLGIAFLTGFNPIATNVVTLVVMSVSLIGVLQSVLNKRKIKCACLGDVFNLPMSSITIIEDGLMIAMSAAMLLAML